jgi:hypothetical protein
VSKAVLSIFLFFLTQAGYAAISVDDSTVPRVSAVQAIFVDLTSGSFTPPANSLLLVMVSADSLASRIIFQSTIL